MSTLASDSMTIGDMRKKSLNIIQSISTWSRCLHNIVSLNHSLCKTQKSMTIMMMNLIKASRSHHMILVTSRGCISLLFISNSISSKGLLLNASKRQMNLIIQSKMHSIVQECQMQWSRTSSNSTSTFKETVTRSNNHSSSMTRGTRASTSRELLRSQALSGHQL